MHNSTPRLIYGPESLEFEHGIVGNEAGLRNLITAAQEAIDAGESHTDIGELAQLICKPDEFFADTTDKKSTNLGDTIAVLVLVSIFGLIGIGLYTVVSWLF